VEEDAGERVDVIGGSSTLVGGEWRGFGGIGVAGGNYVESGGGEHGTQTRGEGQGDLLLGEAFRETCAGVQSAVGWVEDDDVAVQQGCLGMEAPRRPEGEGSDEFEESGGHGLSFFSNVSLVQRKCRSALTPAGRHLVGCWTLRVKGIPLIKGVDGQAAEKFGVEVS
jgi:hypothetical protein